MVIFKIKKNPSVILVNSVIIGPKDYHTVRLVLDTGASTTMLHPRVLLKIGLKPTSPKQLPITTASGTEYVSLITLPKIKALGQTIENMEVCIHDLPPTIPAEGLLGLNFLKYFNVHLNFLENHIKVFKP